MPGLPKALSDADEVALAGPQQRMSEKRQTFIKVLARTGNERLAAEKAGFSFADQAIYKLKADPRVKKGVLEARQALIELDLGGLAYAELLHLITDRDRTPASIRFAACKWVLEAAGHGTPDLMPDGSKGLAEMSLAELAAFIKQGDKVLAGLQQASQQQTLQHAPLIERLQVADLLD